MTGIAWIGTSFFFIWLEASLKKRDGQDPGIAGETWMVHGGGFYLAEKYAVAPERMPDELHWFKYEAYFTWLTGFLLLVVIYYFGADAFLIDKDKIPLDPAWAILLSAGSLVAGWFIYDGICKSPIGQKTAPLAIALFVEIAAFTFFYHGDLFRPRGVPACRRADRHDHGGERLLHHHPEPEDRGGRPAGGAKARPGARASRRGSARSTTTI